LKYIIVDVVEDLFHCIQSKWNITMKNLVHNMQLVVLAKNNVVVLVIMTHSFYAEMRSKKTTMIFNSSGVPVTFLVGLLFAKNKKSENNIV
jgi:hypothetical protein